MTKDFLIEEGEKYEDFVLINITPIEELQATLRELLHVPTGAQVMHIENDDTENLFCLSFKTLPDSSNGAAHILEHTVLCGSRKYPVKDPFFSMNRRSLNTYMNALTGSDFTCYPAASQIEKDFYNLLEVYLDAVFHPQIKELSFLQEGHRYEFANPEDPKTPLEIKGIVYNEMKGAMSSIDSRIWHALLENLVPDLPYAYNSGGEPKVIPTLTYQQLIDFHETYYHPSRCLFFFYGNFPLKKHLEFIQQHALKGVQKHSPLPNIPLQKRFEKPVKKSDTYPASDPENLEKKHIHAFGWLTTPLVNVDDALALHVLDSILMDTDASPLKKAILDSGLCVHADSSIDIEMTEIPFTLVCRECKEDGAPLEELIYNNLKKISRDGIAFHLVEATIHQLEFSRREITGDYSPFGLTLFMRSALAKQHGCSPADTLTVLSLFEDILEKAKKDPHFFTPIIEKYFLKNPHFVHLHFSPDPDLSSKESDEEKKHLEKVKNALNEKQTVKILEQAKKLSDFQELTEHEHIDCLPKVTLNDVPAEARSFTLDTQEQKNLKIFHHDTFTNNIVYADLIFDLPPLEEDELVAFQLFLALWTELGVGGRDYIQNLEYVHAHTGGVGASCGLHLQIEDPTCAKPSFQLRSKALGRNADKMLTLLKDMVMVPRFDEKKRIEELIEKLATSLQSRLSGSGMHYATSLALSGFSTLNHLNHLWSGLPFYQNIQNLNAHLKEKLPEYIEKFLNLKNKLLCNGTPHLVLSCDKDLYHQIDAHEFYGLTELPTKKSTLWKPDYPLKPVVNQARVLPSPVAFTAEGFKSISYLDKSSPALLVSTLLMDNKILHHRIREQGGAYGTGVSYNSYCGTLYFYSYRDPQIARTLRTFHDSIREIAGGNFDETDLEEAKLGIIQYADTPVSPGNRAMVAYIWERDGKTRQMRQTFRDKLLALKPKDIQEALQENLLSQIDKGTTVTFAGKELIDKELPLIEDRKLEVLSIT